MVKLVKDKIWSLKTRKTFKLLKWCLLQIPSALRKHQIIFANMYAENINNTVNKPPTDQVNNVLKAYS